YTKSVPIEPDAPSLFTTITDCPICFSSNGANTLATLSVIPPASQGTTNVISLFGKSISPSLSDGEGLHPTKFRATIDTNTSIVIILFTIISLLVFKFPEGDHRSPLHQALYSFFYSS